MISELLTEVSSEDGEDSRQSASLEDILADDSDESGDESVMRRDKPAAVLSTADRLLAQILSEDDDGVMLPEAPPTRRAELDALLKRADEALSWDPDTPALPTRLLPAEAEPATSPLRQAELAFARVAEPTEQPLQLPSSCGREGDGPEGGDRGNGGAVPLARAVAASGVALAEAAERRAVAQLGEQRMFTPLRLAAHRCGGGGGGGGGGSAAAVGGAGGAAGAAGAPPPGAAASSSAYAEGAALLRLETFPALNAHLGTPEAQASC